MVCLKAKLLGYFAATSEMDGFWARTISAMRASFSWRSLYSFSSNWDWNWDKMRLVSCGISTLQYSEASDKGYVASDKVWNDGR